MEYQENKLVGKILSAAIEVHKILGPGLLESTYENCLAEELGLRDIQFKKQLDLPVLYKGRALDCGYRVDMLVEDELVIELKSVEEITKIHSAQILTYLKLMKLNRGLIINFNVALLKHGVKSHIL